ncbi:LysR family transcriptional regulator [Pseudomonas sp. 18.1.10]|uniref:LysR family transcriptional regulator n=1 Tax=Pseudomonas sp. 18.1.10 TaxID=2969302 RepID=UPI00214F6593|nr:LysR family transcriptional regulator [Pseudomonas sp. 18.1.10]MCR4536895.1 LysR family transcriptional regulator [Pseudomonas sp. 18.1.10]
MNEINIESLDLNLFKVFEALYEEGGAGRAAIRLGITQSAVSAALGRLRVVYGDHLFERTGRGLRPTPKTEELRPLIAMALEKCRQSLQVVNSSSGSFNGRTVTLGLSDDYEMAIGRSLIDSVNSVAAGLRLIFKQTHSMLSSDALMSRSIDIALTSGSVASRTLGRRVIGTGGYACVVAGRDRDSDRIIELSDYLERGHILVSSGGFVGLVDEALAAKSLRRRIEASTTHFAALPHLISESSCVATLPRHAAHALSRTTRLVSVDCPIKLPSYSVELSWRADSVRDQAIQLVKELVTQAVRGLPAGDLDIGV